MPLAIVSRLCRLQEYLKLPSHSLLHSAVPLTSVRQVWTDAPGHVTPESAFYDSTVEQVCALPPSTQALLALITTKTRYASAVCTAAHRNFVVEAGKTGVSS